MSSFTFALYPRNPVPQRQPFCNHVGRLLYSTESTVPPRQGKPVSSLNKLDTKHYTYAHNAAPNSAGLSKTQTRGFCSATEWGYFYAIRVSPKNFPKEKAAIETKIACAPSHAPPALRINTWRPPHLRVNAPATMRDKRDVKRNKGQQLRRIASSTEFQTSETRNAILSFSVRRRRVFFQARTTSYCFPPRTLFIPQNGVQSHALANA